MLNAGKNLKPPVRKFKMKDTLQKILFECGTVRGELVELDTTWQHILSLANYPKAVQNLLGEMLAAAALLSANLKFQGTLIMQIFGDGPVRLLVAECNDNLEMRATAKCAPDAVISDDATLQELVHTKKHGRFAITLDPKNKQHGQQPYQGIVPLDGKSIGEVIESYMLRSEQLDTKLWLATNSKSARGLLLQKIPQEGGVYLNDQTTQETWERCIILNSTLKPEEMLSTDIPTLIRRLYWEETLRLFPPSHPIFHCSCTRDKVKNMLKVLGEEEIENALTDLGTLDINCDFCGKHYSFDKVDCAQLFKPSIQNEDDAESSTKH